MTTRTRRTIEERIAANQAELETLLEKQAGTYKNDTEDTVEKQIRARLRRCNTELRAASVTIHGVSASEGKPARSSISDKILKTEARLVNQRNTEDRAYAFLNDLPADIKVLEALVESMEAGQDVAFPDGLTALSASEGRSDEEHEAMFIAASDVEEVTPDN